MLRQAIFNTGARGALRSATTTASRTGPSLLRQRMANSLSRATPASFLSSRMGAPRWYSAKEEAEKEVEEQPVENKDVEELEKKLAAKDKDFVAVKVCHLPLQIHYDSSETDIYIYTYILTTFNFTLNYTGQVPSPPSRLQKSPRTYRSRKENSPRLCHRKIRQRPGRLNRQPRPCHCRSPRRQALHIRPFHAPAPET